MKNVLITGGSGFIGSNIALKLLDKGYNVVVMDCLSTQIHGEKPEETSPLYKSIKDKVNFIRGSVVNKIDWLKAIDKQDAIIHLAAETGTGQSMYEINKYSNVNIGGTALMLDILANNKNSIKKVILASSRAVYGEGRYLTSDNKFVFPLTRSEDDMSKGDYECKIFGNNQPLKLVATTEDSMIHPTSVYGITKQVQEQLVLTVCPSINVAPVVLRYQNVYGPGQSLSNPYTGILSIFSTRIKNGNGINVFEDGNESRDFVYIDDVVDATISCLEIDAANGNIFNIGSGIPISVMAVAKTLVEKFDSNVPVTISGNYRLGDIRHNFADINKAINKLGFSPRYTFDKGIIEFVKWVNNQKIIKDTFQLSIDEMRERGMYK